MRRITQRILKDFVRMAVSLSMAGMLPGCGSAVKDEQGAAASEEAAVNEEAAAQKAAEKRAALTHIEKYMVEDFYGDQQEDEVYGPIYGDYEA
ncbi:MAG: hypothetical protein K2N00_03175, partial [Lachnospiraceae bacterium]|nr:hypothetical protein [Lachnospiraceae bacterium]